MPLFAYENPNQYHTGLSFLLFYRFFIPLSCGPSKADGSGELSADISRQDFVEEVLKVDSRFWTEFTGFTGLDFGGAYAYRIDLGTLLDYSVNLL